MTFLLACLLTLPPLSLLPLYLQIFLWFGPPLVYLGAAALAVTDLAHSFLEV